MEKYIPSYYDLNRCQNEPCTNNGAKSSMQKPQQIIQYCAPGNSSNELFAK